MIRRTCEILVRLSLCGSALTSVTVAADCVPPGTPEDDEIVCTGIIDSTSLVVDALGGDDQLKVAAGSEVTTSQSLTDSYFDNAGGGGFIWDAAASAEMLRSRNTVTVDMGEGDSEVTIDGIVRADSYVDITTRALAESALASSTAYSHAYSDSTATAVVIGGSGNLTMNVEGEIDSSATAVSDARALTIAIGSGEPRSFSDAIAEAIGIYSYGGPVFFNNQGGTLHATATTEAYSYSASENYSAIYPVADSYADKDALSYAWGIKLGNEHNIVSNHGSVEVKSMANSLFSPGILADSDSFSAAYLPVLSYPLPASALADTVAESTATSTGIEVGDGNNLIENFGAMNASAHATAEASAFAQVLSIPIYWEAHATATASANAVGILTGDGNNIVENSGTLDIQATAETDTSAIAFTTTRTAQTSAEAVAIQTGEGDDTILNHGAISVHADVELNFENIKAGGIRSGGGDDVIVNNGDITTQESIGTNTGVGIGIDSGDGVDKVVLESGSTVTGYVILGTGDDTLFFDGGASVTVNRPLSYAGLRGDEGIDTIVVRGSGDIFTGISGFERVIKVDTGEFSIAQLPTVEYLEVDEGILSLNSAYIMGDDSHFRVRIDPNSTNNTFNVATGTLSLDGDLYVIRSPGLLLDGDSFAIATAPLIEGAFDNQFLPAATALVNFGVKQEPTSVEVIAEVNPFESVAKNRVEWAVAKYLDVIAPSATGDLAHVIGEFQALPETNFERVFSSLSPDSYDNFTLGTYRMIQQYTRGVQRRLSVERSFEHASCERQGAGLSQWIPRAVRTDRPDSDLGSLFLQNEESPNSSRNGFWLGTFGYWGNQDEERREHWIDGGYTGFDVRSQGIILGYDHRVTNQSTLGLSVGYASADIDLYNNTGDGDINNKSVSVYGAYTGNQNYVDAILTYGESDYDNSRNLKIGSIERTAMSDHDGTFLSGALEVGKAIVHENTLFEPFASLHYIRLDEDGFEEKGAGDANLILEGRKTESLVSQIGIRASNDIKQRHGRLTADVELAWVHDFDIDDRIITSSYVGSPQIVFPVEGRDIGQNGGSLNFGVSYHAKNALTVSARVGAEVRDGYRDAGVFGLLQYTF